MCPLWSRIETHDSCQQSGRWQIATYVHDRSLAAKPYRQIKGKHNDCSQHAGKNIGASVTCQAACQHVVCSARSSISLNACLSHTPVRSCTYTSIHMSQAASNRMNTAYTSYNYSLLCLNKMQAISACTYIYIYNHVDKHNYNHINRLLAAQRCSTAAARPLLLRDILTQPVRWLV